MKLYFLYKTICLANQRVYVSVYGTTDLFFGTPHATDAYVGGAREVQKDLELYGRNAFVVESIQAFPIEADAYAALKRYEHLNTYKPPPWKHTEEFKRKRSEAYKGENAPMHGKKMPDSAKQAIAKYRKSTMWIHNGEEERIVDALSTIPEGWTRGRSKLLREKVRTATRAAMQAAKQSASNTATTQT